MENPKEEYKQYPIGGYAPGNYMCKCVTCKEKFIGDKRAVQCEPCAIEMTKEEPKQKWDIDTCRYFDMEVGCEREKCICKNIPNEEPKLTNTINRSELGIPKGTLTELIGVPKQETLEEVAFNYAKSLPKAIGDLENIVEMYKRYSFVEGAKWQEERMYSEEEVKQIIDATLIEYSDFVLADIPQWFEQFKKK